MLLALLCFVDHAMPPSILWTPMATLAHSPFLGILPRYVEMERVTQLPAGAIASEMMLAATGKATRVTNASPDLEGRLAPTAVPEAQTTALATDGATVTTSLSLVLVTPAVPDRIATPNARGVPTIRATETGTVTSLALSRAACVHRMLRTGTGAALHVPNALPVGRLRSATSPARCMRAPAATAMDAVRQAELAFVDQGTVEVRVS